MDPPNREAHHSFMVDVAFEISKHDDWISRSGPFGTCINGACLLIDGTCQSHNKIFIESFELFNQLKHMIVMCHYCNKLLPYTSHHRHHQHDQSKRHQRNKANYKPQLKRLLNNHIDRDSLTVVMSYL